MKENRQHEDTNKANYKQQGGRIIGMNTKWLWYTTSYYQLGRQKQTVVRSKLTQQLKLLLKMGELFNWAMWYIFRF